MQKDSILTWIHGAMAPQFYTNESARVFSLCKIHDNLYSLEIMAMRETLEKSKFVELTGWVDLRE